MYIKARIGNWDRIVGSRTSSLGKNPLVSKPWLPVGLAWVSMYVRSWSKPSRGVNSSQLGAARHPPTPIRLRWSKSNRLVWVMKGVWNRSHCMPLISWQSCPDSYSQRRICLGIQNYTKLYRIVSKRPWTKKANESEYEGQYLCHHSHIPTPSASGMSFSPTQAEPVIVCVISLETPQSLCWIFRFENGVMVLISETVPSQQWGSADDNQLQARNT
jgi:hypothetical protein